MWDQMKGVQAKIKSFVDDSPDGVHMICYSQGTGVRHYNDIYQYTCAYFSLAMQD